MDTTLFLLGLIIALAITNIIIAVNLSSAFRSLNTVADIVRMLHYRIEELENMYERGNPNSN